MKEKQVRLREKLKEIAKEENILEEDVNAVEESMWNFVKERIRSTNNETEEHSNILLKFLGTIFVAPNKIKKIKEKVEKYGRRKVNENT